MTSDFETRIAQISQAIVDSHEKFCGINLTKLPIRLNIIAILDIFKSLIFPGLQSEREKDNNLVACDIGAKTRRLVHELTIEISLSLEYAARTDGQKARPDTCRDKAESIALDLLAMIPRLRKRAMADVEAAFAGDPAAKSRDEIILSYPGLEAIASHRIAHELYLRKVPLIPRIMSEYVHGNTGIDIHPGATIGDAFFIDHATGVVVGETAIIGNNVKLYQGVTIGAISVTKELADKKRHPTIEDDVTIYAGATILGGKTVIGKGSIIGGNVWITHSIPPFSITYNKTTDYKLENRYEYGKSTNNWSI